MNVFLKIGLKLVHLFLDTRAPGAFGDWSLSDTYASDAELRRLVDENYTLCAELSLIPGRGQFGSLHSIRPEGRRRVQLTRPRSTSDDICRM